MNKILNMKKVVFVLMIFVSSFAVSQNIVNVSDTNDGYIIPPLYNTRNLLNGSVERQTRGFGNCYAAQDVGTKIYGVACLLTDDIPDTADYYVFLYRESDGSSAIDSIRVDTVTPTSYLYFEYQNGFAGTRDTLIPMYEVFFDRGYQIDNTRFSLVLAQKNCNTPLIGYFRECFLANRPDPNCLEAGNDCDGGILNVKMGAFYFGVIPIIDSTLRIRHELAQSCNDRIHNLRAEYTELRINTLTWSDTGGHDFYQVAYGPANSTMDNYTIVETTDTAYKIVTLPYGTRYAARVRVRCIHSDSIFDWGPWSDTVHFERPYFTLTTQTNNDYWGYVIGGGMHERGYDVTIAAYPAYSCTFEGWEDGDTCSIRTLTLVSDTVLTAIFLYHPDSNTGGGTLGVIDAEVSELVMLAPNPAQTSVGVTARDIIDAVEIYDIRGCCVASRRGSGSTNCEISLATLPKGLYSVAVFTGRGIARLRLARQ